MIVKEESENKDFCTVKILSQYPPSQKHLIYEII